jgi:hypothetical protein
LFHNDHVDVYYRGFYADFPFCTLGVFGVGSISSEGICIDRETEKAGVAILHIDMENPRSRDEQCTHIPNIYEP